ncbi:Alpha/Beta hydrolase protein [Bombardia bombarda]|uniref:Alpha/Beta hydrolase protein n=1 Tax=Bombardia bombarda TaxID=252184 RepID=A0AA39X1F5_9PEZI|nr:Alpha/Beta hydrolase protein [Bombardia bombarda]
MSTLALDPDYKKATEAFAGAVQPVFEDALSLRAYINTAIPLIGSLHPRPEGVQETKFEFQAKDGTTLNIWRFSPSATPSSAPGPAALYIHGGGMVSGSVEVWKDDIMRYVAEAGIPFFGVGYRLAPEFPFPTPVDDSYAALEWLRDHAAEQRIDPKRIALFGESAGGGIAAGVALMARDKSFAPPIAKQLLIYPMVDDRTKVGLENPMSQFLVWTDKNNTIGWSAYLGPESERAQVSPYAAPARATDVAGLPRTYIDVGGLDMFRDEDIAYAGKLAAASVDVEFHLYPGAPHGWEYGSPSIPSARRAIENRIRALRDL